MTITYASSVITISPDSERVGQCTSASASLLTDTTKTWPVNAWVGRSVRIYEGTGVGQSRRIASNTVTGLVPANPFITAPDATSKYRIGYTPFEIQAANDAGSWGVCTTQGNQTRFSARIKIGNGTLSGAADFCAFDHQIEFANCVPTYSGGLFQQSSIIALQDYSGLILGDVINDMAKTSSNGCGLRLLDSDLAFINHSTDPNGGISANPAYVQVVSSQIIGYANTQLASGAVGRLVFYTTKMATGSKYWNTQCMAGVELKPFEADVYNLTTSYNNEGVSNILGGFENVRCNNARYGFFTHSFGEGASVVKNLVVRNCTYFAYCAQNTSINQLLINPDTDTRAMYYGINTTAKIQIAFEFSFKLTSGGSDLSNARIHIVDSTGAVVTNELTNASGAIPIQHLHEGYYDAAHNQTEVMKTPHTMRIRKYEYNFIEEPLSATSITPIVRVTDPSLYHVSADPSGLTGISITGSTTTLSSPHTLQEIYDYGRWWACQPANFTNKEPWATTDGINIIQSTGRVFTPSSYLTYGSQIISGGTIIFSTPGTVSPNLGAITCRFSIAGTYVMSTANFNGVITLTNTSGGPVIVELPAGVTYTNTGPNITIVEPQIYQSITINNGVAGTRIQIFDLNGRGELVNLVPSSWPYTWTDSIPYVSDIRFRVRAGKVGKLLVTQEAGTATLASPSVGYLLSQTDATIYNSKGIDGSTVTGIAIDDGNLTIELSSGTLVSTTRGYKLRVDPWKLFAYASWWETTEEGIRDEVQTVDAPDGGNIRIYSMGLKNTSSPSYTVELYGAYVVDAITGYAADLVDSSGGNFSFAPDHVVVQYIDLAPGSSVITGDVSDIITPLSSLPTLANIEASTVLAKEATVNDLVIPTGEEIAIDVLNAATTFPINANMVQTNNVALQGDGTEQNKFRSSLID